MIESAVKTASEADTVFLVLGDDTGVGGGIGGEHREGENELTCGEGYDTHELVLPPSQRRLFNAISDLGKPTVLILYAGRPYAIAPKVSRVNGFIFSWGGGEQSGTAFANLIFGDVSPFAKLSVSFPQSTGHIPCYYNHKVSARGSWYKKPGSIDNPGRDYVLSSPDAWYAFGCGLSYTTVKYSDLSIKTLNNGQVMVAENFFSCLKCELVYHKHYRTRSEAQADIFAYIEAYYNSMRPQSALNWLSPVEYEHLLSIYAAKVA